MAVKDIVTFNEVWTPQSNIVFNLVSSDPLIIDDRSEATRKELSQALGLKPENAGITEVIDPNKLVDVIASRNQTSAEFTIIVVRKAIDGVRNLVNGTTIP